MIDWDNDLYGFYLANESTSDNLVSGDTCIDNDFLCDKSTASNDLTIGSGGDITLNSENFIELEAANSEYITTLIHNDLNNYPFSFRVWFRTNNTGGESYMSTGNNLASNEYHSILSSGTDLFASSRNTASQNSIYTGTYANDQWHQIIGVFTSASSRIVYFDNAVGVESTGGAPMMTTNFFEIGRLGDVTPALYVDGVMQGMAVFNKALTATEVLNLYAAGRNYNPYLPTSNFTIDLKNYYTLDNLNNFSAIINGTVYNDSESGTIITPFLKQDAYEFNITIIKDGYFNNTYIDYNITNELFAFINQTNITLNILFNNSGLPVNFSSMTLDDLNNSVSFMQQGGNFNINPPSLENTFFTISSSQGVFEDKTFNLTFLLLDVGDYNVYVEPNLNYINFYDVTDDTPIQNATVTLTYPQSQDTLQLTTNENGTAEFSYINNNVTEFGDYTFKFNKIGYNLITLTENLNSSTVPVNLSYDISKSTININVYDRETLTLLNGVNVSLILLGVFNTTTNNGTYTYQNISLIPQDYTLQAVSEGYGTEQATFTYNNQDNVTLNLYLLNLTGSNTGTLFVGVIDEYYFKQVEAQVTLLEYNSFENGFITVSECLTNTNGECIFNVELNAKTYIITASKTIDGLSYTARSGTAGEILKTDEEVRRLILRTAAEFGLTTLENLIYNVTESFINNVSSISAYFNTLDNTATTVCIDYYKKTYNSKILITNDCTTSNGAISNLGVSYNLNRSNYFVADIYHLVDGNKIFLDSYNYPSIVSISEVFKEDGLGKWIILLVTLVPIGVAIYLENINIFYIPMLFLIWLNKIAFPEIILNEIAIAIDVLCILGIYIARKKIQGG